MDSILILEISTLRFRDRISISRTNLYFRMESNTTFKQKQRSKKTNSCWYRKEKLIITNTSAESILTWVTDKTLPQTLTRLWRPNSKQNCVIPKLERDICLMQKNWIWSPDVLQDRMFDLQAFRTFDLETVTTVSSLDFGNIP